MKKDKKKIKHLKKQFPTLQVDKAGNKILLYKNKKYKLQTDASPSEILKNILEIIKLIKPKRARAKAKTITNKPSQPIITTSSSNVIDKFERMREKELIEQAKLLLMNKPEVQDNKTY